MALEVFGVTAASVTARLPQLDIADDAPITDASIVELIKGAALDMHAAIRSTWGQGAVADIAQEFATDADAATYQQCGRVLTALVLPEVWTAAHQGADSGTWDRLVDQADLLRENLRKYPQRVIGYLPSNTVGVTGGSASGMSASGVAGQARREFDGRANGLDEGGFVF